MSNTNLGITKHEPYPVYFWKIQEELQTIKLPKPKGTFKSFIWVILPRNVQFIGSGGVNFKEFENLSKNTHICRLLTVGVSIQFSKGIRWVKMFRNFSCGPNISTFPGGVILSQHPHTFGLWEIYPSVKMFEFVV